MITPTVTAANLDRCIYCRHPILTAFVYIPAVRGTNLVAPAHARCAELAHSDLPADELEAEKTKHLAAPGRPRSSVLAGHAANRPGRPMTPRGGPAGPPSQREGIKLTLSLVTEPPHLAESLALALEYDRNATMNLTAVMSEVVARYITMIEETPCKVLITDLEANLP